jgi:Fe-S-cluster-containing hydrogenase component 2
MQHSPANPTPSLTPTPAFTRQRSADPSGEARADAPSPPAAGTLDAEQLRSWLRELGADDAGLVSIEDPALGDEAQQVRSRFPWVRSLVAIVVRMHREPIRSPQRSLANLEFHHAGDEVDEIARRFVGRLEDRGRRALNVTMGFPMEMDHFPGRIWTVSHKPVAQAAGLGRIGIHRNLIHPRFGSFVLLGTILLADEVSEVNHQLDFNPCLECKLCVAACPTGAIKSDGAFDFGACYTHNYREFMGGFGDWVEEVVESKNRRDYRERVPDHETASVWQSLSFGANYKAAYCLSVCPAGSEVIGPFEEDRPEFLREILDPLVQKEEAVYVVPGSDAEEHVKRRFPAKHVRHVGSSLRPRTVQGFLDGLPLVFQRGKAKDVELAVHFRFVGAEEAEATVTISKGELHVQRGLHGDANLTLRADRDTWLGFLAGERRLIPALLSRKLRLRGNPQRLVQFGNCFAT